MREALIESGFYTAVRIIGSLSPFLLLLILIYSKGNIIPSDTELFGNGELTIICITLGFGALYSIVNLKKEIGSFAGYNFLFWITFLFVFFGIGLYATELKETYLDKKANIEIVSDPTEKNVNNEIKEPQKSKEQISKERITNLSYFFIIWIIIAVFASRYFEKRDVSVVKSRKSDFSKLENQAFNG